MDVQTAMTERALELLNLPDDGSPKYLLDVGCGSGLSMAVIEETGHHVVGVDISPSMISSFDWQSCADHRDSSLVLQMWL